MRGRAARASRFVRRQIVTPRQLAALSRETRPVLGKLGAALQGAVHDQASAEERAWIARIESLRHGLDASSQELSIIDHGAGQPDLEITAEDASRGRTVTLSVGQVCRTASKPPFWGFLLFRLVRELEPSACLEMGTCLGISTAYQAAALQLIGRGHLVSLEGDPSLGALARANLRTLGLERVEVRIGRFQDTLEAALEGSPMDFVFVDGHHDREATLNYFARVRDRVAPDCVMVLDDITWSAGMRAAWRTLQSDKSVSASLDLGPVGLCVIGPPSTHATHLSLVVE